jgi:hypothetical protein
MNINHFSFNLKTKGGEALSTKRKSKKKKIIIGSTIAILLGVGLYFIMKTDSTPPSSPTGGGLYDQL